VSGLNYRQPMWLHSGVGHFNRTPGNGAAAGHPRVFGLNLRRRLTRIWIAASVWVLLCIFLFSGSTKVGASDNFVLAAALPPLIVYALGWLIVRAGGWILQGFG
jgi:hypothetical protein